jgi:hypothetical protein
MKRVRSGLTYTNVVATLALFLALSGGAVYAANHKITSKQLGKGAVKNKNLAKNAVKNKNLAKNAVSSPKIAKDAVKNADIADGAVNFAKLAAGTDVVATATGGPIPANQEGSFPLNPALTVTPVAGQPLTLHIETRGSLVSVSEAETCAVLPFPVVNGSPLGFGEILALVAPGAALGPIGSGGIPRSGASFPIGLTQPGVPQTVSMFVASGKNCTADSTVQVSAVVTQAK